MFMYVYINESVSEGGKQDLKIEKEEDLEFTP